MEPTVIIAAATAIIGSGGAAWAGVKQAMNGTIARVQRMEIRQDAHGRKLDQVAETVARLDERTRPPPPPLTGP